MINHIVMGEHGNNKKKISRMLPGALSLSLEKKRLRCMLMNEGKRRKV